MGVLLHSFGRITGAAGTEAGYYLWEQFQLEHLTEGEQGRMITYLAHFSSEMSWPCPLGFTKMTSKPSNPPKLFTGAVYDPYKHISSLTFFT